MSSLEKEIRGRKTFAIISHPDAGKTSITEKILLFSHAIRLAGTVKAKRAKRYARSDWMEIEKQRGISVTSSVMQFHYEGYTINLLDTPGHEDFSEDTYRVLTAVDSVLMVIDSSKGIETQTRKLFQVCRDRQLPIMTFMNKMDLEGRDPFELIDEVEQELNLPCFIASWPIGQGKKFAGVYDRLKKGVRLFSQKSHFEKVESRLVTDLDSEELSVLDQNLIRKLKEDLLLLEGAGNDDDHEAYLAGKLSPVFFGSALNNFGIGELLDIFVKKAPFPQPRPAKSRRVDPMEENFSGMVFKIQANMDPQHRDRVAFVRIVSGNYTPEKTLFHVRLQRKMKINHAVYFCSQERKAVEQAFPGDIIGFHDRDTFMIGDTLSMGEKIEFTGIPQFSPDFFCRVDLKNPIKSKQLQKGLEHLSSEGTSKIFRQTTNPDVIIGVVGQLQLEVVKFRLLHEYGADARFIPLPYTASRWYRCHDTAMKKNFESFYHQQVATDSWGHPMMFFKNDWETTYVQEKYPGMRFYSSLIAFENDEFGSSV